MFAVYKREFQSYFYSPIGYVFVGFFLLVGGFLFNIYNINAMDPRLTSLFSNLSFIFLLLVPILTMRMFTEERKQKTDQMLLTSPCPLYKIILGKYFAAVTVYIIALVITGVYPIILLIYGNPSVGEILCDYIGLFLLGCSFISIGTLVSALTENQVTAAVATFAVLLILYVWDSLIPAAQSPFIVTILEWLSLVLRYGDFQAGVLTLAPVVYYVSFSAVMVFLTYRSVEKRRWSEG